MPNCQHPAGCTRPAYHSDETSGMMVWQGKFRGPTPDSSTYSRLFIGYRCLQHSHGAEAIFGSHDAFERSARDARLAMERREGSRVLAPLQAGFCNFSEEEIAKKMQELEKGAENPPPPPPATFVSSEEMSDVLNETYN